MGILAFDIGGTAVKYALYEEQGLKETSSFQTPKNWEEMKANLYRVFESYAGRSIEGVAFSSPGTVDAVLGEIRGKSAVPYLHNFPILKELEDLFSLPVSIENDANCAALAEVEFGEAKESTNAAFFIIGSGIGGAIVINRELYKGSSLFAGEFGYMLQTAKDSLSMLASPVNVAGTYSKAVGLSPSISGKELFERAEKGEAGAIEAVCHLYDELARGIYNILFVFNPDVVIIGGGISVRPDLLEKVDSRVKGLLEENGITDLPYEIKICRFHNDANLLGAVANFKKRA